MDEVMLICEERNTSNEILQLMCAVWIPILDSRGRK